MCNYRHCRARRIAENGFGILANRWQIFHRASHYGPKMMTKITLAWVVLRNYLRREKRLEGDVEYMPAVYADGDEVPYRNRAHVVRDVFMAYLNSAAGNVSWQKDAALRAK